MSGTKNFKTPFEEALERAYEVTGADNPSELIEILGITRQSFYKAKSKLEMPRTWAKKLQNVLGVNPDWILGGLLPKRMADYHHDMGGTLYAMRNEFMAMLSDFGPRYGTTSNEFKYAAQLLDTLEKLRSLLDERAFKELPDVSEEDRLRQYYRGAKGNSIRLKTTDSPTQTGEQSSPAGQTVVGKELEEIKTALQAVGASDEDIRQALLDYVSGGRAAREHNTGTDDAMS